MEEIPTPTVCPACRGAWEPSGACERCGLLRTEAVAALRAGCLAYNRARRAARDGRFDEARACLAEVAASGVPALVGHTAVNRLRDLCAIAAGDGRTASRVAGQDERAARNAAARCDFRTAAFYAERAGRAQPGSLSLQKLRLLTLYGAGRIRDAADVYQTLKTVVPADGDLLRWNFPDLNGISEGTGKVSASHEPRVWRAVGVAAGCAVAVAVAVWRNRRGTSG